MTTAADCARWREELAALGPETVHNLISEADWSHLGLKDEVPTIVGSEPKPTRRFVLAWLAEQRPQQVASSKTDVSSNMVPICFAVISLGFLGFVGFVYLAIFQI